MEHRGNPRSRREASLTAPATSTAGAARAPPLAAARHPRGQRPPDAGRVVIALDRLFPLPPIDSGGAAVVVSADGTPLRNYPSRDGIWRYPVTPAQVSPRYLETLLTYEDRWFYWHPGVNPVALARGWQAATNRRIVSGGSTLTMQTARLIDPQLAGKPSRTISAKLRQAWRAVQLEMHYSRTRSCPCI